MNTPGLDDGHHGIDFAYYRYLDHVGMAGHPIQAVLPGRVAGLINNRPPYGYAVIIETPLENVDPSWINSANLPDPGPFVEPQPATNCPRISSSPGLKKEKSIYHLYAHMLEPSPLRLGQQVACGQQVGKVGTSGTSVNEHLHLETRVGPSGFTFSSLAYYDTSRTEKEAHDYCLWRVSNVFHLFNPAQLLDLELQPIP